MGYHDRIPLKTAPVHMHAMGSTDTQRTACLKDVTSWQNAAKRWVILAAKQLTHMQEIILIQSRTCTKTEYPLKTTPVHMHAMGSTDTQRTAYLKDGTPWQNTTQNSSRTHACHGVNRYTKNCLSKRWDIKTEYPLKTPVHMHAMGSTDTQRTVYLKDGTPWQNTTQNSSRTHACHGVNRYTKNRLFKRWDTMTRNSSRTHACHGAKNCLSKRCDILTECC